MYTIDYWNFQFKENLMANDKPCFFNYCPKNSVRKTASHFYSTASCLTIAIIAFCFIEVTNKPGLDVKEAFEIILAIIVMCASLLVAILVLLTLALVLFRRKARQRSEHPTTTETESCV